MKDDIWVSIIIVNFSTKELTARCIQSIIDCSVKFSYEIIVVDNNSSDNSVEFLRKYFSNITIISMAENLGFGSGNNFGVKVAKGRFILLLNSDTIFIADILSSFIAFHLNSNVSNIGVLGSLMISEEFDIVHSFGNFPAILRYGKKFDKQRKESSIIREIESNYYSRVDIVSGANMFMERELFISLNGFDSNIFLYEEELDLQYRMNLNNLYSFIINERGIIHLEGKSSSNYFKRKHSFISLAYVVRKHMPFIIYMIHRIQWAIYAMIFFKNIKIGFNEKLKYLKLVLSKIS
ncbi:MAG: glycosyltransferase family 2 protein [Bacteroidota bacterium]